MPPRNPNAYQELPYANLDNVIRWARRETYETGVFQLREGFLASVANPSVEVAGQVLAFAAAMEHLTTSSKVQLAQVHDQVARLMQRATVAEYEKAKATYGRNIAPYRLTTRDAGGKLGRALRSSVFYRATYDGIGFVNTTLLNRTARQWHRLNFGARPRGNYTPQMYSANFGGLVAGAFGYAGEEPSAPFGMPRGVWSREGAFYPRGNRIVNPTRGIRAWNFLDAGPRVLAERIGPAYEGLYRDWFESAQRGRGPLSRVTSVAVPSPSRRAFRPG
jgi:hypothetical protein